MPHQVAQIVSGIGPKVAGCASRPGFAAAARRPEPTCRRRRSTRSSRTAWSRRSPRCSRSPVRWTARSATSSTRATATRRPDGRHPRGPRPSDLHLAHRHRPRRDHRPVRPVPARRRPRHGRTRRQQRRRKLEHPGEELVYVVSGELRVRRRRRAPTGSGAGDALHFRTVQQHSWCNPTSKPATALWMACGRRAPGTVLPGPCASRPCASAADDPRRAVAGRPLRSCPPSLVELVPDPPRAT